MDALAGFSGDAATEWASRSMTRFRSAGGKPFISSIILFMDSKEAGLAIAGDVLPSVGGVGTREDPLASCSLCRQSPTTYSGQKGEIWPVSAGHRKTVSGSLFARVI
jgi:hypothetical protein